MIRAFSLALLFLTRIPVPLWFNPTPLEWGRSALFFPVVGLLIGLLLAVPAPLLAALDPGIGAALLLTWWVGLTGGLHLDGLADTADAWIGGGDNREKTLALMKDARSGPMAILAVVLVLLNKFAALRLLLVQQAWPVLLAAPLLGRAAMLFLLLTTPYVRPGGIGAVYASHLPRAAGIWLLLGGGVLVLRLFGWSGAILLLALSLTLLWWRRLLLRRLGGTTGDTLGAAGELVETVVLVILMLFNATKFA